MIPRRGTVSAEEKLAILNCRRLPGRLNTSETALLLGVQEHDIPVLVAARLIFPLGKPAPNAPKYFAAVDVVAYGRDPKWLAEATKSLARNWARKNQRKDSLLVGG